MLYQARRDHGIWFTHLLDRTLHVWARRNGGVYDETVAVGGVIESVTLPGVRVDLGVVFGSRRRRWAAPLSDCLVVVQTD